jgi:hypothetical protein
MADIENINISTSEFSFDNIPFIIKFSSSDESFSSYIYIVIVFFIAFVIVLLFLIYKYFVRGKKVTFQDKLENCYGDGC